MEFTQFKKTSLYPEDPVTLSTSGTKLVEEEKQELIEMIAKVHDDIEGRYELDSYDKGIIIHLLCKLQK